MTKKQLESYRSIKSEIRELEEATDNLLYENRIFVNSTILNYNSGFPVPEAVVGVDDAYLSRSWNRYRSRVKQLEKECEEVESFVESIPDSVTRRIFRMRYIEGMQLKIIGRALHMDKSSISRRIDAYLRQQA